MIESRAALLRQAGEPLSVEQVTFEEPGQGELLVRIVAASVCHSDLHTIANGAPHLPMIIGHEAAGIVEAVGPGILDVTPGQKVALSFVPSCGHCWACLHGVPVECVRGSAIGADGRALDGTFKARSTSGEDVGQMVRLGAFSEKVVVHRDSCVLIDDDVDLTIAALMSCGFLTGAGAVMNIAGTRPGDSVLVVGTGGVGIAAIQGAVVAGAARIVAVDINDDKLATAREFGATDTVDGNDAEWPAQVVELIGGRGVDQAVSAVGSLSDGHLSQLMAAIRGGGTAVLVGAGRAQLDVFAMGRKTLTRTLYGSHDPKRDQIRMLELYQAGKFRLEEMVSQTYTLDTVNDAIDDLRAGKNIRGVIALGEEVEHMTTTADGVTVAPRMHIGGKPYDAVAGGTYESVNPATEAVVALLPEADAQDVDAAVAAARAAFEGEWRRTGPADRQRMILKLAGLIQDNAAELARLDSLEMGMPITRTQRLAGASAAFLEWYAAAARTIRGHTLENSQPANLISYSLREPIGVVGAITPWNTPLPMMMWKLGPVLATGSTLVHKPAEYSSLSALRVAELCLEAGIPPGVVNVITGGGTAGAALAAHRGVDKVAFTGSITTGQAIIRASAGNIKRLTMELGGKSPNIIFADADLDAAAAGAAMSIFGNSGQVCVAGSRLLVERPVYDEFLVKVSEHAAKLRVGDPLDESTDLGPVASKSQFERVLGYIESGTSEGAALVHGGDSTGPGFFVRPTIFGDVRDDMRIAQEEIFGPVLAATPFDDAEEALTHANSTDYGLSSYVWTNDLRTANRFIGGLRAGTVQVNTVGNLDPAVPLGGVGMSGYGKELGLEQLDEYLTTKAVWIAR